MPNLSTVNGKGLLSARNAAGNTGRSYYATDTGLFYRDNGSSWDTLYPGVTTRKTADQTFASTSFADSTNMAFAIAASKNYEFEFLVMYTTANTGVGIKLALLGPTSCTCYASLELYTSAGSVSASATVLANTQASGDISTDLVMSTGTAGPGSSATFARLWGTVNNSTNAGTLKLRHASSSAANSTILQQSRGRLFEIA